jgi:chemotaxis signal transduction protein
MSLTAGSYQHCVFRCGATWYALPTVAVRAVMVRPDVTPLPGCGRALLGLSRLRDGFLPVLSAAALIDAVPPTGRNEQTLLVVDDVGFGGFGLCVDEAAGLASLDPSLNAVNDGPGSWSAVLSGWATNGDRTVHVLDPQQFSAWAARGIEGDGGWARFEDSAA